MLDTLKDQSSFILKDQEVQDYDVVNGLLGHDMVNMFTRVSLLQMKFLPSLSGFKTPDHTVSYLRRP